MRVVVTRPEPGCSRTVALLKERGHDGVPMPLTRIVDLLSGAEEIDTYRAGATVVTSANAIRAWQRLGLGAKHLERPLYAVGERTGQAARDAGFPDVRIGGGDGALLAETIQQDIASGVLAVSMEAPLLYAAGRTRHSRFEVALAAGKTPFRPVELYDIVELSYSTDFEKKVFPEDEPVAVLLYSRKAAELLFKAIPPDHRGNMLNKCKFFCMSANVVNAIPTQFRDRALAAAHPDENHLLSLLDRGGTMS